MSIFRSTWAALLCLLSLQCLTQAQIPAGYQVKTVALPKGAVTILGLCHKPDGTLAVVSWEGEVWEYKDKSWTRFAENLMEPNGIYYDANEDAYYVAQKPELTRLVDSDKDGICDKYECVTDAFGISGEYHEYHYGPVVDSLGRKYASLNLAARGEFTVPDGKPVGKGGGNMSYNTPWRGWVYRSDRHGHFQPLACGFRSPCGIGMSPDDQLFITDNQGDWVADCCLYHVREGNFYGHPASLPARPDFTKEKVLSMKAADFAKLRTAPAVWFPRETIANSPGSPIWDTTGGKFGPFQGQMFVGDQRQSNYFRVGVEKVDGDYQGWCVDFLRGLESGPVKMSFDPEGRLWSAQVGRGWFSVGGQRTALQYAEWDGETTPFAIHSTTLTKTGFSVRFTQPIGKEITPSVKSRHYHYHSTYGSPPVDEQALEVSNYTVSEDRQTVSFEVPLTAGKVYAIQFAGQENAEAKRLDFDTIFYTLNKLRPAKEPGTGRSKGWRLVGSGWHRNDKRRPIPPVGAPLPAEECELPAPKGATVLDAGQWSNAAWLFDRDGVMSRAKGSNSTKLAYGDARIHLEFRFEPSDDPEWTGQLYGNSGVFLMSGYELQVVNSYKNPTFADGMCGAIYGQHPPRVNASRKPGEWQSYDILMKAPVFAADGSVEEPLRATIFHNGVLIQDDVWVYGEVGKAYQQHGKRPLALQDHKGTEVSFRNLWIVPDIDYDGSLDAFRENFGNSPTRLVASKTEPAPAKPPITILPAGMAEGMDKNRDRVITIEEFVAYRAAQFDPLDKDKSGTLDASEFPHRTALKGADKNNDGKLSRQEHSNLFLGQFPNVDVDGDGVITAEDKRGGRNRKKQKTSSTTGKKSAATGRPAKPNIVLILVDDLGWQDVGCYDIDEPSPMETPNIDAFAKKGVKFWQAYAPAPTCAPTRCAILSGIHPARAQKTHVVGGAPPAPHHLTAWSMMSPWFSGRMPEGTFTLARALKSSGYVSGHSGKWHVAINHNAFPQPEDVGFDWTRSDLGTNRAMKPHRMAEFATRTADDPHRLDKKGFPRDQTTEDALTFIRDHKDRPFFLYYATWLVHTPIQTRSRILLDKYVKKLGVELPDDPRAKWMGEGQTNPFYCAMVEQLDHYIGQLIGYLKQTDDPRWPGHKLSENTYVIFTSDNGGMEGSRTQIITDNYPLDRGKISLMEGGTRVPLIIAGPGVPEGVESDVMVNGLDFYPTILSLTGATRPQAKHLDGLDLAPLLKQNPADPKLVREADGAVRDTMIWHFPNSAALESTIRIGDYKLVRNYDHVNNPNNRELELYRLYDSEAEKQVRVDIEEKKNLADSLPEKTDELNARLTAILTEMEASYPYYNPHAHRAPETKKNVCSVVAHEQNGGTVRFTYREKGGRVVRANLIYTLNGGAHYEEWFHVPAELQEGFKAIARLPEGTTHYFLNLIDENNFLRSYPEVLNEKNPRKSEVKYAQRALKATGNGDSR
ncbi:MAG: sulfatase-like hydrolase/transferase [Verrucomicrobiaceae bacterium]|nr:sulfatase-like hydrolase/transferase [Verrucomicrobiaceae bacterium]